MYNKAVKYRKDLPWETFSNENKGFFVERNGNLEGKRPREGLEKPD